MKIKTSVDLIQAIDDDYTWRKREIETLRDMLIEETTKSSNKKNKYKQNCLIKSIVCISYSHWEGFAKTSSQFYLEYIRFLALSNSVLANNLKAAFTAFVCENTSLKNRIETYRDIYNDANYKMNIPIDNMTKTHDNLNFKYLEELAYNIDLDYSTFVTKQVFIDKSLLNYRNKFAHGEANYEVDADNAKTIADETLTLISMFRDEIENMVSLEKYRQ